MKALSIRQPWGWAILYAGKDVENRDWKDNSPALRDARRLVRTDEPFLIHVGMTFEDDAQDYLLGFDMQGLLPATVPPRSSYPRGGIIGSCRLRGVIHRGELTDDHAMIAAHYSRWRNDTSYALVLGAAVPCKFIPLKGLLGFFDVPDDLVREALAA